MRANIVTAARRDIVQAFRIASLSSSVADLARHLVFCRDTIRRRGNQYLESVSC